MQPRPGGLAYAGLLAALDRVASLDGVMLTVGIQGTSATTAAGAATPAELVQIAAANEFGTSRIPSRPWLRQALINRGKMWSRGMSKAVRQMAAEEAPAARMTLRRVGQVMVGDTQRSLRDGPWAPNAASTIARKGSDQPLIDTGQLVQSHRAQVEHPNGRTEVVA